MTVRQCRIEYSHVFICLFGWLIDWLIDWLRNGLLYNIETKLRFSITRFNWMYQFFSISQFHIKNHVTDRVFFRQKYDTSGSNSQRQSRLCCVFTAHCAVWLLDWLARWQRIDRRLSRCSRSNLQNPLPHPQQIFYSVLFKRWRFLAETLLLMA